ncbi:RagB/SusD family nutrient uptake outer membrane protein [Aquimarina sp. ERC-38]|uniref:RagB/SusD family nutrient uptake outer membrane protein n=1 Tax=Aquimarina sp. ERC-38 TaxID=2949996 RepID=UPI0022471C47|nr:RagB/SusD family nutrient uptake outer membrane protein [Aquimarina sp. ERC-38]UZO82524.1 RagB/SusD family nutrient uptake outer membrane protein [Aquimarina sp. ERC-38]
MNTHNLNKVLGRTWFFGFSCLMTIVLVLQGCADLDPDPLEFNRPPDSFGSLEEMERSVVGIYAQVLLASRATTFYAPAWAGDDITTHRALNKNEFREFDQRVVLSSNSRLSDNFRDVLNVINTVNGVLDRSQGLIGLETIDQELLNRFIGESLFIRALMFYHLTRIHGEIPLPLTRIPDPNISKSSILEVYTQIESDLMGAEQRLPDIYPGVLAGAPRPNKGSAKAILARLYMDWAGFPLKDASRYTMAASMAKDVMDNATVHGFGLVNDLEDLWTVAGRFNSESLFTSVFCASGCQGIEVANRKFVRFAYPADFSGFSETFGEIKFFEDFPEGPRKEATYRTDLDWRSFNSQKSPVFKKLVGPIGDINPTVLFTDRNDFIMRYAEILLIYAEASGLTGNVTPEAWEALNQIRRRAAGLPFNIPDASVDITSGDIAELAFTERKWEFAGEYLRWYDLVRRERVAEVLSQRGNVSGSIDEHNPILGSLEPSNYFAPIPAAAVAQNPNLAN